jgi:F-type H+-transporting ATPase subunit b
MEVNWFTVIAQVINFFIFVWLLKKFLYKPVLKAIDDRENLISSQIEDAKLIKTNAIKVQEEFNQKVETFELEKKDIMDQAIVEAEKERNRILEQTRTETNLQLTKRKSTLKEMQDIAEKSLSSKISEEVFKLVRKTLADLASTDLETQIVYKFIKKIHDLSQAEKQKFLDAFEDTSNSIVVQSSFDLNLPLRNEIENTIKKLSPNEIKFQFRVKPELISGIELILNGYKVSWNVSDYLKVAEINITEGRDNKS